jgi:hypothetical protein
MQNKEEKGVVVEFFFIQVEACCVQELKGTEEAWFIEWNEDIENKLKNK